MERCKRQRFLPYWEPLFGGDSHFRQSGREAVAAGVISSVLLVLLGGLLARLDFFAPYSSLLVAVSFLYIPTILSRIWRQPYDVPEGLWRFDRRSLLTLLVVLALVFPGYSIGFSLWQGWTAGRTWCGGAQRVLDWDDGVKSESGAGLREDGKGNAAWVDGAGRWNVSVGLQAPGGVAVETSEGAWVRGRGIQRVDFEEGSGVRVSPGGLAQIEFPEGAAHLEIRGPGEVTIGDGASRPLPFGSSRGVGWLLWFTLVQVLLVALPEEYFYRGYLQERLQRAFGRRLVWCGGDVGPAVWVTSAVFAVGHLLTVPSAFRLAVFFPSLLFGWARDKTGTLWVPVTLHVLSNVLLELLHRMHC